MTKASVSFSVPPQIWENFTKQTNALCISCGPFLDRILSIELPYLQEELKGLRLSLRAKRHISGLLKRIVPLTPNVNIMVRPETADLLRAVVKEHNLVRDAFFCRLLVMLRGSQRLLDELGVPQVATDRGLKQWLDQVPASPMKAFESVMDDPLYYIRHHVENEHGCGLYRAALPYPFLLCYIEDDYVPNTPANKRLTKALLEL